jgi:hypothetical protein
MADQITTMGAFSKLLLCAPKEMLQGVRLKHAAASLTKETERTHVERS